MHYWLLLSRPPFDDRILSRDGLVFRFEPVRYDNCSEELLDCYSSRSSLFAKKSVGLFAEGHHDLIRRFFFNLSVFEYPNGPFEYLDCKYHGAKHIRIPEDPPQNLPKNSARTPRTTKCIYSKHREIDDILSRIVPRCSCKGELAITGEIRTADGWRTGFNLQCKQCGKKWTYSGGIYRQETAETA